MLVNNIQVCDICQTPVHFFPGEKGMNSPMLHTYIWKWCLKYYHIRYDSISHQFLCDKCIEKALGRPIKISDLRPCPLSKDWAKEHYNELKNQE